MKQIALITGATSGIGEATGQSIPAEWQNIDDGLIMPTNQAFSRDFNRREIV